MRILSVRLAPEPWRRIIEAAATNCNEVTGILSGARVGRVFNVTRADIVAVELSTPDRIVYDHEQMQDTRAAILEAHPELSILGAWHTHPWENVKTRHDACCVYAPQLTADDKRSMLLEEVEVIAVAFPAFKGFSKERIDSFSRAGRVGRKIVRVEAWWRTKAKRPTAKPCELTVGRI